jgi:hypothetical protein
MYHVVNPALKLDTDIPDWLSLTYEKIKRFLVNAIAMIKDY